MATREMGTEIVPAAVGAALLKSVGWADSFLKETSPADAFQRTKSRRSSFNRRAFVWRVAQFNWVSPGNWAAAFNRKRSKQTLTWHYTKGNEWFGR
jgi:hypothetical protein